MNKSACRSGFRILPTLNPTQRGRNGSIPQQECQVAAVLKQASLSVEVVPDYRTTGHGQLYFRFMVQV